MQTIHLFFADYKSELPATAAAVVVLYVYARLTGANFDDLD